MIQLTHNTLHTRFVHTFADISRTPAAVSRLDLSNLSQALNTHLSLHFKEFLLHHGAVYVPGILHLTTVCGLEHPDLRQFLTPPQILLRSRELWAQSLSAQYYAFATDCLGNAFCFRKSDWQLDDGPIYFLSRSSGELVDLEETFDGMLGWYLQQAQLARGTSH